MSESKRPVHEVTYFPVRVSIWEIEGDDNGRTFFSTTISRLYK